MNISPVQKSILATLSYYDIHDFPLTKYELYKFCIPTSRLSKSAHSGLLRIDAESIEASLPLLQSQGLVEEKNGFFMLKGRSNIYTKRIEKKKIADQKWKKALRVFRWFQAIPYVRAVYASGSLGLDNTTKSSDLDVLVVSESGRIWSCRFFVSLAMSLLGVRRNRYDKIAPDKVCLNHYITNRSLFIPFHSLYNAQTYAHLVPVWVENKKITENFERENRWVKEYVNVWNISGQKRFRGVGNNSFLRMWARFGELVLNSKAGNLLESFLKKIQSKRIINDSQYSKPGGRIIIDDNQLEFHPKSPEKGVIREYNRRLHRYGINNLSESDSGLL